jgi:cytidyltransferase-like protein
MGYGDIMDVLVYPQNLPNAAPEQWLHHLPDLDMVCTHDSLIGWTTDSAGGRGHLYEHVKGRGLGGLDAHVEALNADRRQRGLAPVAALPVEHWPLAASAEFQKQNHVVFLDDENLQDEMPVVPTDSSDSEEGETSLLGGARISSSLYSSVAVGGTFDGMHYGHRKLLTLAVSSVLPQTGKLLIGVTVDEMLKNKQYSELIPKLDERIRGVKDFVYRLAPGMKNRLAVVPIKDSFGPPGHGNGGDFDALVLSHETLETGHKLNQHRVQNMGAKPLKLLCTRRTEPYGMSSTALRKLRSLREEATATSRG